MVAQHTFSSWQLSNIIQIFLIFFSLKNIKLGACFLLLTLMKTSIFKTLYFKNHANFSVANCQTYVDLQENIFSLKNRISQGLAVLMKSILCDLTKNSKIGITWQHRPNPSFKGHWWKTVIIVLLMPSIGTLFENATQFGQIVSEAAIEFLFLDLWLCNTFSKQYKPHALWIHRKQDRLVVFSRFGKFGVRFRWNC